MSQLYGDGFPDNHPCNPPRSKLVIGTDLDATLVDTATNVVYMACRNIGDYTYLNANHDWHFTGWPENLRQEISRLFRDENFMCNCMTFSGVIPTLYKWKDVGHSIIIITARAPEIREGTRQMVSRLFPMIDKLLFVGIDESKRDLMVSEKLDMWIDDAPHGIQQALDLGIKPYLIHNKYTKKYNSNILGLDVNPVKVISEIQL